MIDPRRFKLIVDTNTLLRALANRESASGRVLRLCEERKVVLHLSRAVLLEYRAVLGDDSITRRHPGITPEETELVLRRLRYFSEYVREVRSRFRFDRDPRDEKFIELAISAEATHIVTHDRDLLSLATDHDDAARRLRQRLPGLRVFESAAFLREFDRTV